MKQPLAPLFALGLVLLLVFSGCAKKPQDLIIGKWKSAGQTAEFSKDGRLLVEIEGQTFTGSWSMPEDHTLKVILRPPGGAEIMALADFTIQKDVLTYDLRSGEEPRHHVMDRLRE